MSNYTVKRPENVQYFDPPKEQDDLAGGDMQQIFSFLLGFIGVFMKNKPCIWGALILLLSSFANLKYSADYKQLVINAGIIIMGLVSLYYWNPRMVESQVQQEQAAQQQTTTIPQSSQEQN